MRIYRVFQNLETVSEFGKSTPIIIGRPRLDISTRVETMEAPAMSRSGALVSSARSPIATVDAAPDLDLSPDLTVSRTHARLDWDDDCWWIEDLGSTHGTRLNGEEIGGRGRLALGSGDMLLIGDTFLRVDVPPPAIEVGEVEIGTVIDAQSPLPSLLRRDSDRQAARRLALIYELPLQFSRETQLQSLLQLIVDRLVEVIPDAARGALLLSPSVTTKPYAAPRDEMENHGDDCDEPLPQAHSPAGGPAAISRTLARRAIDERAGFIWRRGENHAIEDSGSIIGYQIQTGMYAPLLWQGRALGALCVDNPRRNSAFVQDDLRLVMMVAQYAAMAVANGQLQEDLRAAWNGTLDALTAALASRDSQTQSHCYRCVELAVALSRQMGLPAGEIAPIARGALLHDIGKIGIADEILLKPANLTFDERERMKHHVQLGHDMLCHIPFFSDALPVVLGHHENYDGSGYPSGLKGEEIPRGARIFHVVDLYDALTHSRIYKNAWTHEDAIAELRRLSGTRCDPAVVSALEAIDATQLEIIGRAQTFSHSVREMLGRSHG